MEFLDAGKLFVSVMWLSNLAHRGTNAQWFRIPIREYELMKERMDFICGELGRLDLPVSLVSAQQLRTIIFEETEILEREVPQGTGKSVKFPPLVVSRFWTYTQELSTRLEDELSAKIVMIIPSNKVGYFHSSKTIFSEAVRHAFSSAEYDMDEATKCFALARYTACVFHLMRTVERALHDLADKLEIPLATTYDKQWQKIINEIRGRLKTLYPNSKDQQRIKYESALGHLETIKIAWRNPTMHPKATYTEEEARAIIDTVKVFLGDVVLL